MTSPIIDFIEARLAEDEDTARAATPGPWHDDGGCISSAQHQITDYGAYTKADGEPEEWEERQQRADSAHIARHDPARVLREVAAKRRIVAEHEQCFAELDAADKGTDPTDGLLLVGKAAALDLVVKLLAASWSDHPDFDPNWSTT